MPHLEFFEGDRPLFVHRMRAGRTIIGRSDRCDVSLPSDSVSRVHCVIERRTEGWWLVDRSRNGTSINGDLTKRILLSDGDELQLGAYAARFALSDQGVDVGWSAALSAQTRTQAVPLARHEEVVDADEGVTVQCAALELTSGEQAGATYSLGRSRMTLGGPGSSIELDASMPAHAVKLRIVRGRVMVEPGAAPVTLAGTRVREITPALPGEALRVGDHTLQVVAHTRTEHPSSSQPFGRMVGSSKRMTHMFGALRRMAVHEALVLLFGESGTGKELAAHGLHTEGPRAEGPFVAINCAGIPDALFESEVFGHEKGSFTGAEQRQDGAFHRADGGTLFLDEIGELKLDAQAKLLRALETGEVRRVGSMSPEYPDVRVVAATNRDLSKMVREGSFREDLFFRLTVLAVHVPPLRDRIDDVPLLAHMLLEREHPDVELEPSAERALCNYDWPGNVRELRNVLTRAVVLGGSPITLQDITFHPWSFDGEPELPAGLPRHAHERDAITHALGEHGGNRSQAARALGIPRSTLLYKLKKHRIK